MDVFPLPKSHNHEVTSPTELLVKFTTNGGQPADLSGVNPAPMLPKPATETKIKSRIRILLMKLNSLMFIRHEIFAGSVAAKYFTPYEVLHTKPRGTATSRRL